MHAIIETETVYIVYNRVSLKMFCLTHSTQLILLVKIRISGTSSRWTERIAFFRLIDTKNIFLHLWLLVSARNNGFARLRGR